MGKNLYNYGFILIQRGVKIQAIDVVEEWQTADLPSDLLLIFSPQNCFILREKNEKWVGLCCSYCMDVMSGIMSPERIAENMLTALLRSREAFYNYIDGLNGRFICLFSEGKEVSLINDAMALRNVYYYIGDRVCIASHYDLVHRIIRTAEESYFAQNKRFLSCSFAEADVPYGMPADLTPWENIRVLFPNFELSVIEGKARRFYPRAAIRETDAISVAKDIAEILNRESVLLVNAGRNLWQGLSAGLGSRIAWAAMYPKRNAVTFFTYHNAIYDKNDMLNRAMETDYIFAQHLCGSQKACFKEIFVPMKAEGRVVNFVPANDRYFKKNFPGLIQKFIGKIPAGGLILRADMHEVFGSRQTEINAVDNSEQAAVVFSQIAGYSKKFQGFQEGLPFFGTLYTDLYENNIFDYGPVSLFYWEYKCSQWLSPVAIGDFDAVADTFLFFNCRKILDGAMHIPLAYKNTNYLPIKLLQLLEQKENDIQCCEEQYKTFEKYIRKNGQVQFNQEGEFLSGNIYDTNRNVVPIFECSGCWLSIGFANSKVKKGDFCSVTLDMKVKAGEDYCFQFSVKTNWLQGAKGGIVYEILLDGREVYKLAVTSFYFVNQILCKIKAQKDGVQKITFRIRAVQDIDSNLYNGRVEIIDCELKVKPAFAQEFSIEPDIIDTYRLLKTKNL